LADGEIAQPYILQTPFERRLHFTSEAIQSVMRIDDPHALTCAYTRKMMAFLLFNPRPKNIVIVGLGGGSIAKFCYRNLSRTRICAVEVDTRVIALRDEFCVPADDRRFSVVCDDGTRYVARLAERIDVIMVDAFDAVGIAPTLGGDFYEQAAARLSDNGVLVMNLAGEPQRYADHVDRVLVAFGGRALLVPVLAHDNLLLFAFKKPMPRTMMSVYESRAQRLQTRLALEFPRFLRRIRQGHVLIRASVT